MEIDEDQPPLPADFNARVELDKEVSLLAASTQAALDKLFVRYDLDRSATQDFAARAEMAGRLYERMTCSTSDKLVLEFVPDLCDERSDPGTDDLSCLGDPEVWGFPSWLPPPLASLDLAPPVIEAPQWELLDACVSIPWSSSKEVADPRQPPEAQSQPIKVPLPPFAFVQPRQAERALSDGGLSWSQDPPVDTRDDATSGGVFTEAPNQVVPPPPPPVAVLLPMTQQPAAAAAALPLHAPQAAAQPEPQPSACHTVEPEASSDWTWVTNRGDFSSHPTTLQRLRRHAREARRGLVLGASVFRESDNLWLPLREGDDVGLGDLEWRGAAYAAEVSGNKPEAEVADRDWFANAQLPSREPFAAVGFDPEALDSGLDMVPDLSDEDVAAWAEAAFSAHTSLLRTTMRALLSQRRVPDGSKEWVQGTWGPPPPPHVAAMLTGRLALRVLGGKEGETLAAKLIERSFEAVMAKEPERQAKLAAEREEADRAKRQAELRHKAEERKRQEDRRKQAKLEAAKEEQRRAERRAAAQKELERRASQQRESERRDHDRRLEERERVDRHHGDRDRDRRESHRRDRDRRDSHHHDREHDRRESHHLDREQRRRPSVEAADAVEEPKGKPPPAALRPDERPTAAAAELAAMPTTAAPKTAAVAVNPPLEGEAHGTEDVDGRGSNRKRGASSDDEDFVPGSASKRRKGKDERQQQTLKTKRSRSKSEPASAEPPDPGESLAAPSKQRSPDEGRAKRESIRAKLLEKAVPAAMHEMWIELRKYDKAKLNTCFADPVDRKQYPKYGDFIQRPMDLATLGKKLSSFARSMDGLLAFKTDVELISDNAHKFADVLGDSDLHKAAQDFRAKFLELFTRKTRELEAGVFVSF